MKLQFSIIIPVYNRPQEVDELLFSLTLQTFKKTFEVIVVEDGSVQTSENITQKYQQKLNLKYYYKENTGAGLSRNFGMQKANGNYFIIFDSDCIIPPNYLQEVYSQLTKQYTDAYGGADAAHSSFTNLQKAINYSMTSFFTTGGIRGSKKSVNKFQPRSFNLGLSKKAFEKTQGFKAMKVGEDIDLTFRLWKNGFETQFIPKAFVYHKRRSTLRQFYKQTFSFGNARPFLNERYPKTARLTYWFPALFLFIFIFSMIGAVFYSWWFTVPFAIYFFSLGMDSFIKNKKISVALLSIITTLTQFTGYGLGFLKGKLKVKTIS